MGRCCCVPNCKSNYLSTKKFVSTFSFPKNGELREKWVSAIQREKSFAVTNASVVCIKHFADHHIIREDSMRRDDGTILASTRKIPKLTIDAFPTIFPDQNSHMIVQLPVKRRHPEERKQELSEESVSDLQGAAMCSMNNLAEVKMGESSIENSEIKHKIEEVLISDVNNIKHEFIPEEGITWDGHNSIDSALQKHIETELKEDNTDGNTSYQLKSENEIRMHTLQTKPSESDTNNFGLGSIKQECNNDFHEELEIKDDDESKFFLRNSSDGTNDLCNSDKDIIQNKPSESDTNIFGFCSIKQECNNDFHEELEIKNGDENKILLENSNDGTNDLCNSDEDAIQNNTNHHWSEKSNPDEVKKLKRNRPKIREDSIVSKCSRLITKTALSGTNDGLKCRDCDFTTTWKSSLKKHMRLKHHKIIAKKEKELKCNSCDYSTTVKWRLKFHIDTDHLTLESFRCPRCDHVALNESCLKIHIERNHLDEKDFKCSDCNFSSAWNCSLLKHTRIKHKKIILKKMEECYKCDYTTISKNRLKDHINNFHFGEHIYKCNDCNFSTIRESTLHDHEETVHLKESSRIKTEDFRCISCDYSTTVKTNLQSHIKNIHLQLRKYKCNQCDYSSISKSNLESHIDGTHFGVKKFTCNECDFSTAWKRSLQSHMRTIHLKKVKDKTKFHCNWCDYTTTKKWNLQCHINHIHLMQNKYKCHLCGYGTIAESNLKIHIESVHNGEKKYKCNECNFATAWKRSLQHHIEMQHLKGTSRKQTKEVN